MTVMRKEEPGRCVLLLRRACPGCPLCAPPDPPASCSVTWTRTHRVRSTGPSPSVSRRCQPTGHQEESGGKRRVGRGCRPPAPLQLAVSLYGRSLLLKTCPPLVSLPAAMPAHCRALSERHRPFLQPFPLPGMCFSSYLGDNSLILGPDCSI